MRAAREILQKFLPVASNFWLIILILTVAAFHTATVRQGHIWGDDFAMYVHHAKNIVEGRPYAATGYLFHPSISVSPRMYPPVFPLFLAPVIRLFGLNLLPMKIEQVIFFVLALAAVGAYWRQDLKPGYSLALIAVLGFSPHFWAAKDNVRSDLLFLFFFYVAALLVKCTPLCEENQWALGHSHRHRSVSRYRNPHCRRCSDSRFAVTRPRKVGHRYANYRHRALHLHRPDARAISFSWVKI